MIILLPLLAGGHFGQQHADRDMPGSVKGPTYYRRAAFLFNRNQS
jgi:hypothetical protein